MSRGGDVTLKVEGLRELEKALLDIATQAPALIAKGLREPMKDVRDDARRLVPKRTGALHDALDLTPVRRATAARASSSADALSEVGLRIKPTKDGMVGTGGKERKRALPPRSYWHMVEFGTSQSPAKPFIRPAFDANTGKMVGDFKAQVGAGLERIARRNARRRKR